GSRSGWRSSRRAGKTGARSPSRTTWRASASPPWSPSMARWRQASRQAGSWRARAGTALLAGPLTVGGCGRTVDRAEPPAPSVAPARAERAPHTGVVERIDDEPGRVAVGIRPYQAIYYLPRSDPSFDAYRRVLQTSK